MLFILLSDTPNGSYVGTNAMGVLVRVQKINRVQYEALGVIREEIREFTKAIEKESVARAVEEAMDAKATLERFILGEHLPEGNRGFGWWERVK